MKYLARRARVGDSLGDRFWRCVVRTEDSCWEWTGRRLPTGYGLVWFDGQNRYAHRASWELHHDPVPLGMFVCHLCDTPSCVNPGHLFLGTPAENSADMAGKPHHKLTEAVVRDIRAAAQRGLTHQAIADVFGTSRSHIGAVVSRKRWGHVE